MLERLAEFVARHAWTIAIVACVCSVAAGIYGVGVAGALSPSGFEVEDSEATAVAEVAAARFGQGEPDVIALVDHGGLAANDPRARAELATLVADLRALPDVRSVQSPLEPGGELLVSHDGGVAMLAIDVLGDAVTQESAFPRIAELLHRDGDALDVLVTGPLALAAVGQETAEHDLQRGEIIAFPLVGMLLIAFFRGRVAAVLPLLVGGVSIAFATATLRALSMFTDISLFALNIVTLLGLGLAIDYSLFIVQRFRDELTTRTPRDAAVASTAIAGKTMLFSGVAVAIGLLALLVFPIALLRSIAIGGTLIVLLTMASALVVLPALLVVLGRRIDWPRRSKARVGPPTGHRWARLASWVMHRPIAVLLATAGVLLSMGTPVRRIETGLSDARMFPAESEVRRAQDVLDAPEGFGQAGTTRYVALLTADRPITDATVLGELYDTHAALEREPDVTRVGDLVTALDGEGRDRFVAAGSFLGSSGVTPPGLERLVDGNTALVTIVAEAPRTASERGRQIDRLQRIAGRRFEVQLGGHGKLMHEVDQALEGGLLPALAIVAGATLVTLTLAFGSLVVSTKAVVMNVLSLSASFGALVWVFQDGRYERLLHYDSGGAIDPLIPIIMFSIVFGLSMDYELFLLSRIREAYDRTKDPHGSVAAGLAATGPLFSMAALMLIVVLLGFGTGRMLFVKQLGLGMALAVAVDATVVRALLVPASMRLLGRWNWWAPAWFSRWWTRSGIGVREHESPASSA